ncbi:hypothetical protein KGP36_05305 [Patescibacteria group bacterium]|nr:hypothetical protein [Patescibacteria group bacterium]
MKINLKSSTKRIMKPKLGLLRGIGRDPYLDWVLVLGVALLFAFVLTAYGIAQYFAAGSAQSAPADSGASLPKIDTASLQKILNSYDARSAASESLSKGYSGPTDPSI